MFNRSLRAVMSACGLVLVYATNSFADSVAQPIPEPATMTMLAIGAAGVYFANRRRS